MHDVNLLAVLVAGFIPMIVGALWYGPLFGKRWLTLMETTPEKIQQSFNPVKTYGVSFLLSLVTAFVLAQIVAESAASALVGIHTALLVVVAFVLPLAHQSVAFEGRKPALAWMNLAYNAVAIAGQALVVSVWR